MGGLGLVDIKVCYEARNTVWLWCRGRQIDQRNKMKFSETDPFIYIHLNNAKVTLQRSRMRNDSIFNKWCWANWICIWEKNEIGSLPSVIYKNQFQVDYSQQWADEYLTTSSPRGTLSLTFSVYWVPCYKNSDYGWFQAITVRSLNAE